MLIDYKRFCFDDKGNKKKAKSIKENLKVRGAEKIRSSELILGEPSFKLEFFHLPPIFQQGKRQKAKRKEKKREGGKEREA